MGRRLKILVGAAAGYIGSRLVPELVRKGHLVEVVDLLWFGNYLPKDIKVIKKDLFDSAVGDLEGFDQFIFLAGLSNDPMAEHSPSKNFIYNGALPSYLAYLAKKARVKRFIYASSCSVYGFANARLFNEQDISACHYPYGISKLQGEKGAIQLQDEKFSVIALRQGTVCGYSPRMRMDLIINAMFKTAILEGKILVNNPKIFRPIYDIRDCVQGFINASLAPENLSGIFNVASGNFTVLETAKQVQAAVLQLTGKLADLDIKHLEDFRSYRVSTKKAKQVLGFHPTHNIFDIVQDLYSHLSDLGDLEENKYYNIRIFKEIARREELRKQKLAEIEKFKY